MLTYNRGQWIDDLSADDEEPKISNGSLTYQKFENLPSWNIGIEHIYEADVYWIEGDLYSSAKYKFFVIISTADRFEWFLVTDYPSLLMLAKELEPIIRLEMDKVKFEYLTEEHVWKVKELGLERKCGHM